MADCIIFCAGELCDDIAKINPDDYILAADGGLQHVIRLGLTPNGCIGDFDSLGYVPEGAQVFPVEKDDTDAMLAVKRGLSLGFREFLLYGSLDGTRLDHTVANFQTLQFLADHGAVGYLIGRDYIVTVLKNGTIRFCVWLFYRKERTPLLFSDSDERLLSPSNFRLPLQYFLLQKNPLYSGFFSSD